MVTIRRCSGERRKRYLDVCEALELHTWPIPGAPLSGEANEIRFLQRLGQVELVESAAPEA